MLDLVLLPSKGGEVSYQPPIGSSDHLALLVDFDLGLVLPPPPPVRKVFHWKSANWGNLKADLKARAFNFEGLSVQEAVDLFIEMVQLKSMCLPPIQLCEGHFLGGTYGVKGRGKKSSGLTAVVTR